MTTETEAPRGMIHPGMTGQTPQRTIPDDVYSSLISVLMDLAGYDIEAHLRFAIRNGIGSPVAQGPIPAAEGLATDWNRVVDWAGCGLRVDWAALLAEEIGAA